MVPDVFVCDWTFSAFPQGLARSTTEKMAHILHTFQQTKYHASFLWLLDLNHWRRRPIRYKYYYGINFDRRTTLSTGPRYLLAVKVIISDRDVPSQAETERTRPGTWLNSLPKGEGEGSANKSAELSGWKSKSKKLGEKDESYKAIDTCASSKEGTPCKPRNIALRNRTE